MSCIWQEGNLVSPGASLFCFSLVPHQCLPIEETVLVLHTFCSSRILKKAHFLMHRHHLLVFTGSPDTHRFSFHTNHALIYKNPWNLPFIVCLCSFICQLRSAGMFAVNSQWPCTPAGGFVSITRFIYVSVVANIWMLCCILPHNFIHICGKLKMLMQMLRNTGFKNFVLFCVRWKALSMSRSIKCSMDESLCVKVWRKRKHMLKCFIYIFIYYV